MHHRPQAGKSYSQGQIQGRVPTSAVESRDSHLVGFSWGPVGSPQGLPSGVRLLQVPGPVACPGLVWEWRREQEAACFLRWRFTQSLRLFQTRVCCRRAVVCVSCVYCESLRVRTDPDPAPSSGCPAGALFQVLSVPRNRPEMTPPSGQDSGKVLPTSRVSTLPAGMAHPICQLGTWRL